MPALVISSHLLNPLSKLYAMYSDMYKDEYNFRPRDWEFWAGQLNARDRLWAHINARFGEERVRAYAVCYDL